MAFLHSQMTALPRRRGVYLTIGRSMNNSAMPGLVYFVPDQEEETLRRVIEE